MAAVSDCSSVVSVRRQQRAVQARRTPEAEPAQVSVSCRTGPSVCVGKDGGLLLFYLQSRTDVTVYLELIVTRRD